MVCGIVCVCVRACVYHSWACTDVRTFFLSVEHFTTDAPAINRSINYGHIKMKLK